MKSSKTKRVIALMLCMVMILSCGTSALADEITGETATVESAGASTESTTTESTVTTPEPTVTEDTVTTSEPTVTEDTVTTSEPTTTESTVTPTVQEAMQLKHEFTDANGAVIGTVTADIQEATFAASTSEVTMEVTEVETATADEIKTLMKKSLAEDKVLGSYFLYNVSFKVNGVTTEPGREIKITFEQKDFKIDDTKKQMSSIIMRRDLSQEIQKQR